MPVTHFQNDVDIKDHDGSAVGLKLGGTLVTSTAAELNALDGLTSTVAELNILDGVTATKDEINRAADRSTRLIAAGATLTLDEATHDGMIIHMDQATGSVITLPAATGTGIKYTIIVSVTVTSNLHSINCAGTDEYAGVIYAVDTDTSDAIVAYPALAADNFDAIDMDGSTKGGLSGDRIELVDIASGVWAMKGDINQTGTPASPLSAT